MNRRGSSRRSSRRRHSRRRRSTMSASSRGSGRSEAHGDEDNDDLVRELDDNEGSRRRVDDDDDDDDDDEDDDNGDKAARDAMQEMVNQEIILCKINRCKELIQTMKQQTWKMSKKMLVLRKARAYVEKVEGKLSRSRGYQQRWNQLIRQTKRNVINAVAALLPWEMRIKRIESHFGSVVASYFTFLRWLIWISLWLAVLPTCFIIIPEMLVGEKHGSSTRKEIPLTEKKTAYDLKTIWDAEGVVKYSLMFYGYYGNARTIGSGYMLPLAYLIASLAAFAFSFIVVLKTMAGNSRESQMGSTGDEFPFSWKLFTEWDFMIGNSETATTKHASIITVFKETILEEQEKAREANKYVLLSLRVTANLIILLLLALSTYIIQLFVERSRQMELTKLKNPAHQAGFWNENELTIIMTMIATLFPNVLDLISVMEKYHPRTSLRLMLARIFVLNLLNLYTLFIALYNKQNDLQTQIVSQNSTLSMMFNCTSNLTTPDVIGDVTNNCTNENSASTTSTVNGDDCWETTIGQEIYKLTIMDTVFVLGQILIVDIVRSYFIKYCNTLCCWDMEKTFPEYPDFKTAENLLHLISNQGTIWLGSFFAPGLPLLNLLKLLLLLYVRCWTIMTFNAPQERIFRASRSNNFYFALLLVMLFLCMLPPLLAIVAINPSKDCGPYSGQDKMYHIITSTINDELPASATTVLSYSQSPAIILPVFMLLGMTIYYLVSISRSLKDTNQRLAMQLDYERTEGRRKVYAMADAKHENANKRRESKGWGKAKSKLMAAAKGKQSGMGNIALAAVAMLSKKQDGQGGQATDNTTTTTKPAPRTGPKSIKDIAMQSRVTATIENISSKSTKKGVPAIPVAVVKGKQSVKINSQGARDRDRQHIDNAFNTSEPSESSNRRGRGRSNRSPRREHTTHTSSRGRGDPELDDDDVIDSGDGGGGGGGRRGRTRNRVKVVKTYSGRRGGGSNNRNEENDDDNDDDEEYSNDSQEDEDYREDNDINDDNDGNDDDNQEQIINEKKKARVSKVQSLILQSARQSSRESTNNRDVSSENKKPAQDARSVLKNKLLSKTTNKPTTTNAQGGAASTSAATQPKKSILERIRMFQKENSAEETNTAAAASSSAHSEENSGVGGSSSSSSKKDRDVDIEANPRSESRSEQPHTSFQKSRDDNGRKKNNGKTKAHSRGQFLTPYSDDSDDDEEDDDDDDHDNNDDIIKECSDEDDEESTEIKNAGRGNRFHKNGATSKTSNVGTDMSRNRDNGDNIKQKKHTPTKMTRDGSPLPSSSGKSPKSGNRNQSSNESSSGSNVEAKMEIVNEKVEKKSKKANKKAQLLKGKDKSKNGAGRGLVTGKVPEILVEDFTDVNDTTEEHEVNDKERDSRHEFKEGVKSSSMFPNVINRGKGSTSVGGVDGENEFDSAIVLERQTTATSSLTSMMKSKGRLAKWRKVASTLIKGKRKPGQNKNVVTTTSADDSDSVEMATGHNILGLEDLKMNYLQSENGKLKEEKIKRPRTYNTNNNNSNNNPPYNTNQQNQNDFCLPSTSSAAVSTDPNFQNPTKTPTTSIEDSRHHVGFDTANTHTTNNTHTNAHNPTEHPKRKYLPKDNNDKTVHRSNHNVSNNKHANVKHDQTGRRNNVSMDPNFQLNDSRDRTTVHRSVSQGPHYQHEDASHQERGHNQDNDNTIYSRIRRPSILYDRRASLASIRSDRPSLTDNDDDGDEGDDDRTDKDYYNDNDDEDDDVRSGHYNPHAKTFHYKNHGINTANLPTNSSSSSTQAASSAKPADQNKGSSSRIRRRDSNSRPPRVGHGRPTVIYGITNAILEVDSESQ